MNYQNPRYSSRNSSSGDSSFQPSSNEHTFYNKSQGFSRSFQNFNNRKAQGFTGYFSQGEGQQLSRTDFSNLLATEDPSAASHKPQQHDLNAHPFTGSRKNNSQTSFSPRQSYVVQSTNPRKRSFKRKLNEITFDFIDPQRNPKSYRHDIDGLRGFACLLVAIFHIWVRRTSGGVDVFLTVSGFFFLPSLLRKICRPTFQAKDFNPLENILNILRRLWPAMVVVLFAVYLIDRDLLPETSKKSLYDQIIASFAFVENWYMYITGRSYLTASANVSPLQHLWSMAIQGQFFIATILFILVGSYILRLFIRRTGRNDAKGALWTMLAIAIIVTITSFIWATYVMATDPSGGYYDTYARVWEPMAGGLIGIFSTSIHLPRIVREIMAWAGFLAILFIGEIVNGTQVFPGPWALVPVLSTLAIISSYNPRHDPQFKPMINRLFSGQIFQWFGRISYPLYLWHWPLLIIFLTWRPYIEHPDFVQGTLIIIISIGLSWLTATFVENPVRSKNPLPFPLVPTKKYPDPGLFFQGLFAKILYILDRLYRPAVMIVLTVFIGLMYQANVNWKTFIAENNKILPTPIELYPGAKAYLDHLPVPEVHNIQPPPLDAQLGDLPITTLDRCINDFHSPAEPIVCEQYGDVHADKTMIVAGGSHAEHWMPALNEIAKEYHYHIITILRMGCELSSNDHPMRPTRNGNEPYPECVKWEKMAIQEIIKRKPTWLFTTVTRPTPTNKGDWTPNDYIDAFKEFRAAGIQILGMRDSPWPHLRRNGKFEMPATCILQEKETKQSFYHCGTVYSDALSPVNPAIESLKDFPNIHLLDLTRGICDIAHNYCPAVVGNVLVWHDYHHLSTVFVKTLKDELVRQLTPVMNLPVSKSTKTHSQNPAKTDNRDTPVHK